VEASLRLFQMRPHPSPSTCGRSPIITTQLLTAPVAYAVRVNSTETISMCVAPRFVKHPSSFLSKRPYLIYDEPIWVIYPFSRDSIAANSLKGALQCAWLVPLHRHELAGIESLVS